MLAFSWKPNQVLLRTETQVQQWPTDGLHPCQQQAHRQAGSCLASQVQKCQHLGNTAQSSAHQQRFSPFMRLTLPLKDNMSSISRCTCLGKPTTTPRLKRSQVLSYLCAVIRYRTTKGFAVSDRACGLCGGVSLWLMNTLSICLNVRCPEHLLQPSLGGFYSKTYTNSLKAE